MVTTLILKNEGDVVVQRLLSREEIDTYVSIHADLFATSQQSDC